MKYSDFENIISQPRLARYKASCNNNTKKTVTLYRANIRLSQKIFSVLNLFEIALRNSIDNYYKSYFHRLNHNDEWLLTQSTIGGFLSARGCHQTRDLALNAINKLGNDYTHDKTVAELSFGFWRYLFAPKQYLAGGSILLNIFIARPPGISHTDIYNKLKFINDIRNRIAHHEPICFGRGNTISTHYAEYRYNLIIELIIWLGYDSNDLLYGIDSVSKEINFINTL